MVLALVKNLVFPQVRDGEHQCLIDAERGRRTHSVDSSLTVNGLEEDENDGTDRSLLRWRISPRTISDATIGLSDGLTVPFALTAGLSAMGTTKLVIYAGFAELVAGAISMGLGGYLGAKGEAEGYFTSLKQTRDLVANDEQKACELVRSTFDPYSFPRETLDAMTKTLRADPKVFVDFLMRFHLGLVEADFVASRAYISGLTIAAGYFFGGLVPLAPYLFFDSVSNALSCSAAVMAIALFVFGWMKTVLVGERNGWTCFQSATQMVALGGCAAAAAMGCVKAIGA